MKKYATAGIILSETLIGGWDKVMLRSELCWTNVWHVMFEG
jgi:hypothetical protein